jgi:hypothetical protein
MEGIAFKYEVYSKRTLISNNTKIVSKESTFLVLLRQNETTNHNSFHIIGVKELQHY